jgi:hypothetical protein
MSDFNEPAYPEMYGILGLPSGDVAVECKPGLTIRQQAALMIAAGFAANPSQLDSDERVARWSVDLADAVLKREAETR